MTEIPALSPSELYLLLKDHLEQGVGEQRVQGEVGEVNINQGKFVFFQLKDAEVSVKCFMLIWELERLGVRLEDGMEVMVAALPSVFKKNTGLHLRVREIRPVGAGALQAAFRALKTKLETEGLFAQERKRPMPRFPERIAVITSPDAAAWTDLQRVIKNRMGGLRISLLPVSVQGMGAPTQIVDAFRWLNAHADRFDAVVLTRGGGSLEDLWAFNDERVVRAVFASTLPVMVGVGHERDVTLCDFVADLRASTPSNAAERLVPSASDVLTQIALMLHRQESALCGRVESFRHRVVDATSALERAWQTKVVATRELLRRFVMQGDRLAHRVHVLRVQVLALSERMSMALIHDCRQRRERLQADERMLTSLHPHRLLRRGYSIALDARGRMLTQADQASVGDRITTVLHKGRLQSLIQTIHE